MNSTEAGMDQPRSTEEKADELTQSLPPRLADFLARLAYLAPVGQELALETLGPGSRLVLEALRLVETGRTGGLTEQGQLVSERLAEHPPTPAAPDSEWHGGGLLRIARIIPVDERNLAAAAIDGKERAEDRTVVYELSPDSGAAGATVEVFRADREYWLWQNSGIDDVVVVELMEALPRKGDPFVLDNPGGEAPSMLLRTKLALSRGSDG